MHNFNIKRDLSWYVKSLNIDPSGLPEGSYTIEEILAYIDYDELNTSLLIEDYVKQLGLQDFTDAEYRQIVEDPSCGDSAMLDLKGYAFMMLEQLYDSLHK